jgi:hypothetical protein
MSIETCVNTINDQIADLKVENVIVCECSMANVASELEKYGLHRVNTVAELTGMTYLLDAHCDDMIHFPCDLLDFIEMKPLVEQRHLIIQVSS